jgi:hypothetical protein
MQDTIVTMYCLCDDLLQAHGHREDVQARLSDAEIMLVVLVACRYFGGNQCQAQEFLHEHEYLRHTLSRSRFNRRLHRIPLEWWMTLFDLLAHLFKSENTSGNYSIDSMPFPVCDNIRIRRCRLVRGEKYRGKCASKRRFFYGFKVHLVINGQGKPVEFVLTPGSVADVRALKFFALDLPPGAVLHGDRAYNDYAEEDLLWEAGEVVLRSQRKHNSKRPMPYYVEAVAKGIRQRVETTFSQIELRLPRHIHAVTEAGFVLKILGFVLAFSVECLAR